MKIWRLVPEIIIGILQLVCLFVLGGIFFLLMTGLHWLLSMARQKRTAVP